MSDDACRIVKPAAWTTSRRHASRLTRPSRGFTLLELVLVCVVLGILLVASIPNLQQAAQRLQVEEAAFGLAQHLRYAHERAVALDRQVIWAWDGAAHTAQLYEVTDEADGSVTTTPVAERFGLLTLSASRARLTVQSAASGCPPELPSTASCLTFSPDGTSQAAVLILSAAGSSDYTITLQDATSGVRLQKGTAPR